MEKQTKTCDTIVVNELLAFVQNQLGFLHEINLQQICLSKYKKEEIAVAKTLLFEYATTPIIIESNPEVSACMKNMTHIIRFFKESDPVVVPTFISRDLYKLPPVTLARIDFSKLLQDINTLKSEVTLIKKKLEASERTSDELRREVTMLRSANGNVETTTPVTATSADSEKIATMNFVAPVTCKDSLGSQHASANKTSQPSQKAKTNPERSSYIDVSRFHPSKEQAAKTAKMQQQKLPARECGNVDEDGFTLVKKKNRPRRYVNKRGTGPAAEDIRATPTTMFLYISRLDQQTSGDKLLQYIITKSLNKIGTDGRSLLILTRLDSIKSKHFKSYKLQIPAKYKDVFLSTDFWPSGVVYRRYRQAKPNTDSP